MKQVLKYEAQRDHAMHLQNQLRHLLQQVQQADDEASLSQQQLQPPPPQHGRPKEEEEDSYYYLRLQEILSQPWSLTFQRKHQDGKDHLWYRDGPLDDRNGNRTRSTSSSKWMDAILTKEAKRRLLDQQAATAVMMNREGPMAA